MSAECFKNITSDWYRRDDIARTPRLAGKCASEAVAIGIEMAEIQEEIGSTETVIPNALEKTLLPRATAPANLDQEV